MRDINLLIEQLSHDDYRIRMSAAKAIGQMGDASLISSLESLLEDESVAVIRSATLAIGAIGGCEQLVILEPLLEHPSIWVRKATVQAIGMSGCQDVAPLVVNLLGNNELDSLAREALLALKVDPDFF